MPKQFTDAQVAQYRRDGYVHPLAAFTPAQAENLRLRMDACEQRFGPIAVGNGKLGSRAHLLWTWVDEIVHHPAILDAVEDLIGPDIRVYTCTVWAKSARDAAIVDWHQDASYFGLEPYEQVTVWTALTPSNDESGCVEVLPGSHLQGPMHHGLLDRKVRTLLPRGQSITTALDTRGAVKMRLAPGETSFHHTLAVHYSGPNNASYRRIGVGVSYIPTRVRFIGSYRLSAMLVRGTDRHGFFDDEPRPRADADEAALAAHERITANYYASKKDLDAQYQAIDVGA